MGTWRRFRMVLHAENGLGLVPHSLNSLIVQIDTIHFHLARKRLRVDGEAVVLRRNLHTASLQIFNRLVGAAMSEFEFESLASQSQSQNLVPKTNSKNRHAALD